MSAPRFEIISASSPAEIEAVRMLFQAYVDSLGVDLAYQGIGGELAGLPGKYAPPGGELLLAQDVTGKALGCVAMRPLDEAGCCEMKRLYVVPAGRGLGLGRALAQSAIAVARQRGYTEMRLDSLPFMGDAQALYRQLGFAEIPPYYQTPVAGTLFMSLKLA